MLGPSSGSAMRSVAIENPVENISVSTTRRAPDPAALAIIGARRGEIRVRLLPDDVVLDAADLHAESALSRATASSSTSGRLQHAQRTSGAPATLSS